MTGCLVESRPISSLRRSFLNEGRTSGSMARGRREHGEDYEESTATRGLDVLKPYKSASHSWRMDAKASSYNSALIRSHSLRLLPSFVHTAWNKAQPSCWVWSTKNASLMSLANTTARLSSPCP